MIAYLVISSFLISLLTLFFFVAVLTKGNLSFNSRNLSFCVFSLSIFVWSVGHMMWLLSDDPYEALFWVHVLVAGSIVVPYAYFHFAVNLTERVRLKNLVISGYAVAFFLFLFNFSDNIVVGVEPRGGFDYWPVSGAMFISYLGGFVFMVLFGAALLFSEYRHADADRKNQLRYITIGSVIGFLGGATNFFLWFQIPIPPFGHAAVIFYILGLGYSMLKFRTLDFSEMAFRVLGLVVIAIIFSGLISLGLIFLMSAIYRDFYPDSLIFWWVVLTLLSIFLLTLGPSVNGLFNNFLHERFLSKRFAYRKDLRELSDHIKLEDDLDEQFEYVVDQISEVLSVSEAALYTRSLNDFNFVCSGSHGERGWLPRISSERINFLLDAFDANQKTILVNETIHASPGFKQAYFRDEIVSKVILREGIVVPVMGRTESFGFLILGKGRHRTVFSDLDFLLVENICSQLGLSMKFREIERGSNQVEKLISLGTLAAGLSHELRNPLVSIKTLSSLLRKSHKTLQIDEKFSLTVQEDVKRITSIVEGVSAFARNTDGSFKMVVLNEIIEESIAICQGILDQNKVKASFQYNPNLPELKADRDQLVQVFRNLIENAVNGISEWEGRRDVGKINIRVYLRTARDSEQVSQWLIVEVEDNGPGIPKDFQHSIFDPFVTSRDTGLRSGSRGTGLGLAIVSKIVERHCGIISINSDLGKGAVFTVSLPVKK